MAQPIWNTPAGTLGTYPYGVPMSVQLSVTPVSPGVSITYALISGSLPAGVTLTANGLISGTPTLVTVATSSFFTIRATDDLGNLRDRSFSIIVSGSAVPRFSTPEGSILSTQDSIWVQYNILVTNPSPSNEVIIELREGLLPPGLEITLDGVIRGYANPPTNSVTLPNIITTATTTSSTDNSISCLSTNNFTVGRPVVFTDAFGNLTTGVTYYIKNILSSTTFTVSSTQNGQVYPMIDSYGNMTVTLPAVSTGEPTIRTYSFTLQLSSPLGNDTATYAITVINQNTPVAQGGPGKPPNTRVPALLNTRPKTINIPSTDPYYGYYILPPVAPTVTASFGMIESGDRFAIKIIGNDFDNDVIKYSYSGLPSGVTGDPNTGWISGSITLSSPSVSKYDFTVAAYKQANPSIISQYYNYSFVIYYNDPIVRGIITWITNSDLGTVYNGSISTLGIVAESDTELQYRIVDGSLPPNLTLSSTGDILGKVAIQPTANLLSQGDSTTFNFTVEAYSPLFGVVTSTKEFTLEVLQQYSQPTDILYMKATPSVADRVLIASLLENDELIPPRMIYRPDDIYFGKATSVVYEHAYGIHASDINEYIAAVTKNHYWRNITLGELKTAVARDSAGNIIYEVVYSAIVDNLVNPKYDNFSATSMVAGKTYTIVNIGTTDFTLVGAPENKPGTVFTATGPTLGTGTVSTIVSTTSVSEEIYWDRLIDLNLGPWYDSMENIYTSYEKDPPILGQEYYTSLTPGYARILYPNSLPNMRNRVAQELGQEYDSQLLPLWMTSQQNDGSTLGYTQAWVICYTKPGFSETIKNNINTNWPSKLNMINFQLDRFSVNKSDTYDYDKNLSPPAWIGLPSATPTPNPLDSKDFYVLFPRQTILPDETQY
jgi:hypothetical protein